MFFSRLIKIASRHLGSASGPSPNTSAVTLFLQTHYFLTFFYRPHYFFIFNPSETLALISKSIPLSLLSMYKISRHICLAIALPNAASPVHVPRPRHSTFSPFLHFLPHYYLSSCTSRITSVYPALFSKLLNQKFS